MSKRLREDEGNGALKIDTDAIENGDGGEKGEEVPILPLSPESRVKRHKKLTYVPLTTHPGRHGVKPVPLNWYAKTGKERGPVIAVEQGFGLRNAIGAHSGGYCIYLALAAAAKAMDDSFVPDLTDTMPAFNVGPHPSWSEEGKIATMDPYGHAVMKHFSPYLKSGYDIRPTIACTRAHVNLPEIMEAMRLGRLKADGKVLHENGQVNVCKAAVEAVWVSYFQGKRERGGDDGWRDIYSYKVR